MTLETLFSFEPEGGARSPVRLIEADAFDAAGALGPAGEGLQADLVYVDPPFASGGSYVSSVFVPGESGAIEVRRPAFDDASRGGIPGNLDAFLPRLGAACGLLRPGGSLYVHLDWRLAAYVRVHLDRLLGPAALRNEIVWRRNPPLGRKARAGQFGRVTDTILFYVRPGGAATFQPEATVRVARPGTYRVDPVTGQAFRTAPRGDYTDASIRRLEAEGRIHRTRSGALRVRYDLEWGEPPEGGATTWLERRPVDCLWLDIPDAMHVPPAERTGYATQKPERLLERIVRVSSRPGDLVIDPYCGSGTTPLVAARLERRGLGVDRSPIAVNVAFLRLARAGIPVRAEGAGGGTRGGGSARAPAALRAAAAPGGRVRLVSYRPELPVPDWPGARRAAAAAEPSNGLALLDGWGVGRAGDGPPRLERWWPRGDDGLVPDEGSVAAGSGGRLRVLGIDVFGGRVVAAAGGG